MHIYLSENHKLHVCHEHWQFPPFLLRSYPREKAKVLFLGNAIALDFPIMSPTEMTSLLVQVDPLLLGCVLLRAGFSLND